REKSFDIIEISKRGNESCKGWYKNDGIREFTQGFHIQNRICKNTHISYALHIIENYDFKPEEAKLHKNIA
ncbi:MAG: hypothetical protein Q4C52_13225, partial [Eubacteriales bacterium]|nr:hypothetical protein [Eubacteriales bacterium]